MPLTLDQRLQRLTVRNRELGLWRVRERAAVSGWTFEGEPIGVGAGWPRLIDEARFEASAEVPAHWPLDEARLGLDVGGESLLTLEFGAGARARFGLDPNHREFPLRGRRFSAQAVASPRAPFGQPVRAPRLERAELLWLDVALETLHLRLTLIAETIEALKEHEVALHLIEAAEAALRMLRWPSASADVLAHVAGTSMHQSIWAPPDIAAEPAPLDAAARASVVAAADFLSERLKALKAVYPPQGAVLMTGHAHIDLAWLWPYAETRRKLSRTFSTALELMDASPEFRFNQSSAHYYDELERNDPELFAAIRARAAEGRWEPTGALWVEPDTNMPSGESLVRQALYGQLYFERVFGKTHSICWLPDCFGFSPALPQILRQAGVESFITIKVNWSETNRFPHDLFWWEGLDGSRVLAHTFDNPDGGYNGEARPESILPTWRNFRGKTAHSETLLAVGFGDGGGGPTPEMLAREVEMRDFPALPRARWGRVDDFFARAHASADATRLPVWRGEIYLELHRATLTSQSAVKRLHRRAEQGLVVAETLGALAYLIGAPSPSSLERLWRDVLKSEFHDVLPGSSIREVYEDAERELSAVIAAALAERERALASIAERLPRGGDEAALIVVNPSLSARPLRARAGDEFVATGDVVPPLSIAVLRHASLAPAGPLSASSTHLENATLRAEIGPDGTLARLLHKPSRRDALAGRGAQLWAYPQDKPRNWDAWDIEEDYAESGEELTAVESVEVVERGAHRVGVRVVKRWRGSRVALTYALAANARRLDIGVTLDWRDRRVLLRMLTPADVRANVATFECAFGVVERPTHVNTSWQEAMFEAAAHRFVDLSEPGFGLALLNDAKYGHSVRDNNLGVSLVRSPYYPDPLADEGEQSFSLALMPHTGDWRTGGVREEAEDLNQPLIAAFARGLALGVVTPLATAGVEAGLAALKAAEDGDGLVVRVYEPSGARGPFAVAPPSGWRIAGPVDLLERAVERKGDDLKPFEIRSWRLRRG